MQLPMVDNGLVGTLPHFFVLKIANTGDSHLHRVFDQGHVHLSTKTQLHINLITKYLKVIFK
jgi:hypothetical protein